MNDFDGSQADFPDQSALQQLARALWGVGSVRGAAVLIGAGLSKNAQMPGDDTPQPPLWFELLNRLADRLYPGDPEGRRRSPLRIAEEYRTFFGQSGLDDFIRSNFPDHSWSPGKLHLDILSLPWTDVLTTNWDTLLERAAEEVSKPAYSIVRSEADLTYAQTPRIIKLHGSIGDKGPLIFAEEDYRTYPTKYASYVNLARQIFIENELVLVGFSGDDPNFLHWAGWVRDHLGSNARRIYLAGNLNLKAPTRKYLETLNIIPIDLSGLVKSSFASEKHAEAIRLFLSKLKDAKPKLSDEWHRHQSEQMPMRNLTADEHQRIWKEATFAAQILRETLPFLAEDRASYPKWIICPARYRFSVQNDLSQVFFRSPVLSQLTATERSQSIFERLWRCKVALTPLDASTLKMISDDLDLHAAEWDQDSFLEALVFLIAEARIFNDKEMMLKWQKVLEAHSPLTSSYRKEAQYQFCLYSRDRLDYDQLSADLDGLLNDTPEWRLKRAALYAEIGEDEKASDLITAATIDLERRFRQDRRSIWVRSRLAWAMWLNQATRAWKDADLLKHREYNVGDDPKSAFEFFEHAAREIAKNQRESEAEVIPSFDLGRYIERGKSEKIDNNSALLNIYAFERFSTAIGLPTRVNHVDVSASTYLLVLEAGFQRSFEWYASYLRNVHSHFEKSFDRYFGRIAIAQLGVEAAMLLEHQLENAIKFWFKRWRSSRSTQATDNSLHRLDVLRLLLHALSRVIIRGSETDAERVFRFAVQIFNDAEINHPWLIEAAGALATNSLRSMPILTQAKLSFDVIDFPLPNKDEVQARYWPPLTNSIWDVVPERDPTDSRWDTRIAHLLSASNKGSPSRDEAIFRLFYLARKGVLRQEELVILKGAIWSDVDEGAGSLPINTGLLYGSILELESGSVADASLRFRFLFDRDLVGLMHYPSLLNSKSLEERQNLVASVASLGTVGCFPSEERAVELFDQVVSIEFAEPESRDAFGASFNKAFNHRMIEYASQLLSQTLVPAIRIEHRNELRLRAMISFIHRYEAWTALEATLHFVQISADLEAVVSAELRTSLLSSRSQQVSRAALVLRMWIDQIAVVPPDLVERLVYVIETGREAGLHTALDAASRLLATDLLSEDQIIRLGNALKSLHDEYGYDNVDWQSRRAVLLPLIRVGCVRLAAELKKKPSSARFAEIWLDQIETDPLPEVRFALTKQTAL